MSATSLEIGRQFRDAGIYMGLYAPMDEKGKSLGKTYHVFAASQLRGLRTFSETSKYLETSANGFKVENPVSYHKELEQAFKDGSVDGKLIIPPLELVNGKNARGDIVRPDENMFALKNAGDFKRSYATADSGIATVETDIAGIDPGVTVSLLASSPPHPDHPSSVRIVDFWNGLVDCYYTDHTRANCRPVRVIEVGHLTL